MFTSKVFGGRAGDTFITKNSGLELLIPGDQLLADCGFNITDEFPPGVTMALLLGWPLPYCILPCGKNKEKEEALIYEV